MKEISRTKGNSYNKIDQSRWMLYPRHKDIKVTSFLDAKKVTFEKYDFKEDENIDVDIAEMLEIIMNKDFGIEEPSKVKKLTY